MKITNVRIVFAANLVLSLFFTAVSLHGISWHCSTEHGLMRYRLPSVVTLLNAIGLPNTISDHAIKSAYVAHLSGRVGWGEFPTLATDQRKEMEFGLDLSFAYRKLGISSTWKTSEVPGSALIVKQDIHRVQLLATARYCLFDYRNQLSGYIEGGLGGNWGALRNLKLYHRVTNGFVGQQLAPKNGAFVGMFGCFLEHSFEVAKKECALSLGYRCSRSTVSYAPTIIQSQPDAQVPQNFQDIFASIGSQTISVVRAPVYGIFAHEITLGISILL